MVELNAHLHHLLKSLTLKTAVTTPDSHRLEARIKISCSLLSQQLLRLHILLDRSAGKSNAVGFFRLMILPENLLACSEYTRLTIDSYNFSDAT